MQLTKGHSSFRARWVVVAMLFIALMAAGVAVWLGRVAPGNEGPGPSTTSTTAATEAGGKPPINWDNPIIGTDVATTTEAAAHVSFTPFVPKGLGNPVRIQVDSPSADHGGMTVAFVYQHPAYGRFFLIERKSSTTQADLEALAGCNHDAGCEGEWTLVKLKNGTNGLLITGGPTTGIMWLSNGVLLDVFGPIDTFTVPDAMAVTYAI